MERDVVKIKNLTKQEFEELGVFIDISNIIGREYIVWKTDGSFVELIGKYKMILPVGAVEFVGMRATNTKAYSGATEASKKVYAYKEKKHRTIMKNKGL